MPTARVTFEDFWEVQLRKVAKKDARRAWARIPVDKHLVIMEAALTWRGIWLGQDINFLPHPATWLNGERWEDEVPDRRITHEKRKGLNERRAETIAGLTGEDIIDITPDRLD